MIFHPDFRWDEIDPQQMISISVVDPPQYMKGVRKTDRNKPINPIYALQPLRAQCRISGYYFSKGVQWAIKWKNGSLIQDKGTTLAFSES
jgi:hypothetical protein